VIKRSLVSGRYAREVDPFRRRKKGRGGFLSDSRRRKPWRVAWPSKETVHHLLCVLRRRHGKRTRTKESVGRARLEELTHPRPPSPGGKKERKKEETCLGRNKTNVFSGPRGSRTISSAILLSPLQRRKKKRTTRKAKQDKSEIRRGRQDTFSTQEVDRSRWGTLLSDVSKRKERKKKK